MFQPIYHVSISPTDGNGPTQGQRKTLTRVGIEPTTFGFDHRCSTDWATRSDGSRSWELKMLKARQWICRYKSVIWPWKRRKCLLSFLQHDRLCSIWLSLNCDNNYLVCSKCFQLCMSCFWKQFPTLIFIFFQRHTDVRISDHQACGKTLCCVRKELANGASIQAKMSPISSVMLLRIMLIFTGWYVKHT